MAAVVVAADVKVVQRLVCSSGVHTAAAGQGCPACYSVVWLCPACYSVPCHRFQLNSSPEIAGHLHEIPDICTRFRTPDFGHLHQIPVECISAPAMHLRCTAPPHARLFAASISWRCASGLESRWPRDWRRLLQPLAATPSSAYTSLDRIVIRGSARQCQYILLLSLMYITYLCRVEYMHTCITSDHYAN